MEFKIDTREKFTTITLLNEILSDNITGLLDEKCREILAGDIKNVILNFAKIQEMDLPNAQKLIELRMLFFEQNASFVICELQKEIQQFLDQNDLLETLNITPTESEAWDIVQMEEIEREYLDDDFPG
ncbi:MAG: STAS domain-containing protein [Bacteroidetes bacterium]|nr:STAS domain-containing protein [Bacteroidota bacterium]